MYTSIMPRASRHTLPKETLKEIQDHFFELISSLTNELQISEFLQDFLTKEEKLMLSKRLMLYMMLKRNLHHATIQQTLQISYETVRTHAQQFADKNNVFQAILEKLSAKEKTKELWSKMEKALKPLELMMQARNDMKARAKLASGDWS